MAVKNKNMISEKIQTLIIERTDFVNDELEAATEKVFSSVTRLVKAGSDFDKDYAAALSRSGPKLSLSLRSTWERYSKVSSNFLRAVSAISLKVSRSMRRD